MLAMEQLANNLQIQLSKRQVLSEHRGTALEGVSGGVHPWVLNFTLVLTFQTHRQRLSDIYYNLIFQIEVILLLLIPVLAVIASVISTKVTFRHRQVKTNTEGQAAQNDKVNES